MTAPNLYDDASAQCFSTRIMQCKQQRSICQCFLNVLLWAAPQQKIRLEVSNSVNGFSNSALYGINLDRWLLTMWPRNFYENAHLSGLRVTPANTRCFSTASKWVSCSAWDFPNMRTTFIYRADDSGIPFNNILIHRWNSSGALVMPNGKTLPSIRCDEGGQQTWSFWQEVSARTHCQRLVLRPEIVFLQHVVGDEILVEHSCSDVLGQHKFWLSPIVWVTTAMPGHHEDGQLTGEMTPNDSICFSSIWTLLLRGRSMFLAVWRTNGLASFLVTHCIHLRTCWTLLLNFAHSNVTFRHSIFA